MYLGEPSQDGKVCIATHEADVLYPHKYDRVTRPKYSLSPALNARKIVNIDTPYSDSEPHL